MSTQVSFVLAQAHDAIVVPVAVLDKPEADGSYHVQVSGANQQLMSRDIKIGIRNQKMAQVLAGLAPGEQVVVPAVAVAASASASVSRGAPPSAGAPLPH
ncbi:hypothetical protein [Collimonas sp.]|uniref:hypothetical protein n=1 Tax=Collimonas sp. TaxID=1963772 RepID=UPI0037BE6AC7